LCDKTGLSTTTPSFATNQSTGPANPSTQCCRLTHPVVAHPARCVPRHQLQAPGRRHLAHRHVGETYRYQRRLPCVLELQLQPQPPQRQLHLYHCHQRQLSWQPQRRRAGRQPQVVQLCCCFRWLLTLRLTSSVILLKYQTKIAATNSKAYFLSGCVVFTLFNCGVVLIWVNAREGPPRGLIRSFSVSVRGVSTCKALQTAARD